MDAEQVKIAYGLADRHFYVADFASYGNLAGELLKLKIFEHGHNPMGHPIIHLREDFSMSACVGGVTTFSAGAVMDVHKNSIQELFMQLRDIEDLYQSCKVTN